MLVRHDAGARRSIVTLEFRANNLVISGFSPNNHSSFQTITFEAIMRKWKIRRKFVNIYIHVSQNRRLSIGHSHLLMFVRKLCFLCWQMMSLWLCFLSRWFVDKDQLVLLPPSSSDSLHCGFPGGAYSSVYILDSLVPIKQKQQSVSTKKSLLHLCIASFHKRIIIILYTIRGIKLKAKAKSK